MSPFPRLQQGAVLFVALVFLLVLTVLALAASSSSIMQERMTGGLRNRQLSQIATETTVRGGERHLWKLNFAGQQPFVPCVDAGQWDCVYRSMESTHPVAQRFRTERGYLDPASDGARPYDQTLTDLGGDIVTASVSERPRYIIEQVGVDFPAGFVFVGKQDGVYYGQNGTRAGDRLLYRITARGYGGTNATLTIQESIYSSADLTNTGFNPDLPTP